MYNNLVSAALQRIPLPPLVATFESTKVCNLHCDYCRRWYPGSPSQIKGVGNHFTLVQFKEALRQLKWLRSIWWMGDGEPLLNPDFNSMIEYASSRRIYTVFTTNGMLVTPGLVDFWKRHKVQRISISFDSPIPEKYEEMRKGAHFDTVVQACKLISVSGINLNMNIVMFQNNVADIPKYVELSHKVGARLIYLIRPHFFGFAPQDGYTFPGDDLANTRILAQAQSLAKYHHLKWYEPWYPVPTFRRCVFPFVSCYIEIGGAIKTCCWAYGTNRQEYCGYKMFGFPVENYNMGNILKDNFNKVWRGESYKELRRVVVSTERKLGTTTTLQELANLRERTDDGRFSGCITCMWRWSAAC